MEREKALDLALSQIEKQFGEGAIMRLGEQPSKLATQVIPTGALSLDICLGVGGLPRGRIVEIYGQEASGKTTIALHALAEAQKHGGAVAFIDAEHAFPREYAQRIGLNLDELLVSQPDTAEQALEIADVLVASGALDAFALDSVAAMLPAAELAGDVGDAHVGLQARLMSQALRKLAGAVSRSNTLAIFINQIREKIGVMFGNPETTPGGRALKFQSTVRLEVRRKESLKRGADIIGNRVSVKAAKNKVAPPFKRCEFDIIYGEGISAEGCLLDEGVEFGLVEKAGTWFSYDDERLGQGRDNAREYLRTNPELAARIEAEIRERAGLAPAPEPAEEEGPDEDA
ncbi:MAG: recombinase RecA [Armatimonadota bacterium]|jgi:recombination protein RecA